MAGPKIRASLAALAVALIVMPTLGLARARAAAPTIVSLTFDDGRATQYAARSILASHGMRGTFYVDSGLLGSYSFWMTWQQVQDLAADGNEIGGHTAYHANLTAVDPQEAQRQICDDRVNLLNHGYAATSFAYPHGAYDSSVRGMVQACGYNSARSTVVLNGGAESTPPADPYVLRIGNSSLTLTNLKNAVRNAEATGGWVPLMFHDVCNGCSSLAISPTDLSDLLDWLQAESVNGVVVRTVQQAMSGPVQPAVAGPGAPAAPNGTNGVRNASLEVDANGDARPECWDFDGYGTNTYTWTRTSDAHSGLYAERVDVTNYSSGERKLVISNDLGACTPTVTPGHRYVVRAWYKSTAPVYFTAYVRNTDLAFTYLTDSSTFPARSTWTQAVWTTPVIAGNVRGISFGLAIGAGSLTLDDVSIDDAAATGGPDTNAPSVALTSPASGATLANQVTIAATASDDVAIDHVDYLVDGQVVGSTVNGPMTLSWNSRSVANGTHIFAARAIDTSGNSTTSASVSATVANQPVVNLLNNPSLETGGNPPDCWQVGGASGGVNTYVWTHTTDAHSGSFGENLVISSYTSGDRKLVSTQSQACAPAATPGHAYTVTVWYKSTISAWFYAYYRDTSGVWTYLTQSARPAAAGWTQATFTTPAMPANANKISVGMGLEGAGSLTMDDFTLSDAAPPPDTTAPTSTITCNNNGVEGTCGTGWYPSSVLIQLAATDNPGGTGVASIRYTTDGTDPSPTNGSTYSGPFGTTGTVKYRAYDFVGNEEAIHTQPILVDGVAPTTAIACNGAPCTATPYSHAVSVTLSPSDGDGSGVASTRFTTDGTDPSPTNGTDYSGPIDIASTTTLKVASFDNVGNAEAVVTQVIAIDLAAPAVSVMAPQEGVAVGGTSVTLAADATDEIAISSVEFLVDGSVVGSATAAPYSIAWDSTTVADGPHTLTARATDSAGNASTSAPVGFTVDNVAPGVSLTAPADGASVTGSSVTLAADPTDEGAVNSVEFLVDGAVVGAATRAPYSMTWDSTTVADGAHTVSARATDWAGNTATSTAAIINVDNAGPGVNVTAPAEGSTVGGSAVEISATAGDDGSPISSVEFLVDGSVVGSDTAAPYLITWDSTTVADGSHSITARATDGLGNVTTSAPVGVTVDNTGPSVAFSAPASGATVSGSTVMVSATATDGSGVASVEFLVDGVVVGAAITDPYSIAWDSTTFADGSHSLTARATDGLGNVATSAPRTITVDNSGPTTALTAPADGATVVGTTVTISATATDPSGVAGSVQFLVDGVVIGSDAIAPYSITWNSSTVADGAHSLTARATDGVGNVATSAARTVTVQNAPVVALTAPANGATVSGRNVTVSATASGAVAVSRVDFYAGATLIGTDTTAPYAVNWNTTKVTDGTYSLTARATNAVGQATTSAARIVTVRNDTTPPSVSLTSPAAGATVSGTTVTIAATASDNVGVARVDFYVGATLVGSDTTSPYSISWNSTTVLDGTVTLTARAFDLSGNSTTSAPRTVTVRNAPVVSVVANASLETDANGDGVPDCFAAGGSGNNAATYARVTDAHTGSFAERLTVTGYKNGSRTFETVKDSGGCAIAVDAGRSYTVGLWYKSNAAISIVVSYRDSSGTWVTWVTSPTSAASTTWAQKTFTTAALPAGATHLSFGIRVASNAVVTVDDYSITGVS